MSFLPDIINSIGDIALNAGSAYQKFVQNLPQKALQTAANYQQEIQNPSRILPDIGQRIANSPIVQAGNAAANEKPVYKKNLYGQMVPSYPKANEFANTMALALTGDMRVPETGAIPQAAKTTLVDASGKPITSGHGPTGPRPAAQVVADRGNIQVNMPSTDQVSTSQSSLFPPITEKASSQGAPRSTTDPFATSQSFNEKPQRTYPVNSNPSKVDVLENQKRNIQIDGHDIKTPQDKAQINSTLNGYGIQGPFENQLQGVNDKISELGTQAKALVANQGGTIAKSDLVNLTAKNLAYGTGHNVPLVEAQNAANNYINKVYAKVAGVDPNKLEGFIAPDQIPGPVVQDMKSLMNKDSLSTFNQPDPMKWTSDQTVSRYGRNATDNVLDTHYPNASKLNNDMSDLIKSQESLRKGVNQESVAAQKSANTPNPGYLPKILGKIKDNPLAAGAEILGGGYALSKTLPAIAGAGAGALGLLGDEAGQLRDNLYKATGGQTAQTTPTTSKTGTNQPISYQFPDLKPNPDGSWTLDQKQQPSGQYMSDAQRKQREAGLPPNDPEYIKTENDYNRSQTLAQNAVGRKGDPVFDFMTASGPSLHGTSLMLTEGLSHLPTGFTNIWKPGLDIKKYVQSSNGDPSLQDALSAIEAQNDDFSAQYQRMLNKTPGDDLTIQPGDPIETMRKKLNRQANFLKGYYKKYEDPFLATSTETGTANQRANVTAILPPTSGPNANEGNVGFSHPNAASYLTKTP